MASDLQERSLGWECISTKNSDPADTEHTSAAGVEPLALQARLGEVTSVMGEFPGFFFRVSTWPAYLGIYWVEE